MSNTNRKQGAIGWIGCAILNLITAAIFYFGGSKEIMWLTVVGFIFAVLNVIVSFVLSGMVSVLSKILLAVVGYFWIIPKIIIAKGGSIADWLVSNGTSDVYYVARVFALVFALAIFTELIANIDKLHGD